MFKVTKEFIKDLKTSDHANFKFSGNDLTITFIKSEKKKRNGWIKPGDRKEYREENKYYYYEKAKNARFYIMYQKSSTIHALAYLLKNNDEILFSFMDNSNDYLRRSGLHNDELTCRIYRKDKMIIERMVLTHSICENNSARSIAA